MLLQTPSSAQMLCGICKLGSVVGEPSTALADTTGTNLNSNQEEDPQNPDATISKYVKQLGSLCQ